MGSDAVKAASDASKGYNDFLAYALNTFLGDLSEIEIFPLDVFALLHTVVDDFKPGTCLTFYVVRGAICPHPNEYLFWDAIHPTTAGHDVLSDGAKEVLGIAP